MAFAAALYFVYFRLPSTKSLRVYILSSSVFKCERTSCRKENELLQKEIFAERFMKKIRRHFCFQRSFLFFCSGWLMVMVCCCSRCSPECLERCYSAFGSNSVTQWVLPWCYVYVIGLIRSRVWIPCSKIAGELGLLCVRCNLRTAGSIFVKILECGIRRPVGGGFSKPLEGQPGRLTIL